MKISKITGVQNIKQHEASQLKPQAKLNPVFVSIPISGAYLGRDLVSFGNRPFHETLKDNYFQLPDGCFPDAFQIEAGKGLNEGQTVLVEAPTGTGKTAIAHYAVTKNLEKGKTTFYTTPLKALSNQKLNEFREIYGEEKVGILTGDRRENADAPIVIMTTEVYRNMALQNAYGDKNPMMENLGTVIFDEFHYLGDASRGPVWEESLIYTPKDVQTLELSATIGNPEELKNWISSLSDKNVKLVSIPSKERHVPLKFSTFDTKAYLKSEKWIQKQIEKIGTINYDEMSRRSPKPDLSDYKSAVEVLERREQLPAIFFVFSRKFSRELLDYLGKDEKSLTNEKEKTQIKEILEKYKSEKYIGNDLNETALLNGYAIHNAGIIPSQKELIEELFQKKLIKTVIATETLAAGINMPAKTVVISSPYKPSDVSENEEDKTRILTVNEFKQMAGRAGRRGIDTQGYVYTMPTDRFSDMDFLELERKDSNPLKSQYDPDYSFLCGFFEHNENADKLKNVFEQSFYAYSDDEVQSKEKIKELTRDAFSRVKLLKQRNYLTEKDGLYSLNEKGLLASKIKGYEAIPIVDMITGGKMKDITPETLAMIAGAIANPVNSEEGELSTAGMEFDEMTSGSGINTESVKARLEKSVSEKLKMLGKSIDSFSDYETMLNYAQGLEKPETNAFMLRKDLQELSLKRSKMYIVTKNTGSMSVEELVKAISDGKTIPTKYLEANLETVEKYKKSLSGKDINLYVEKLTNDLELLSTENKGKKVQTKIERQRKEIRNQLNEAKNMKYLDDNLYEEINKNYLFLKKNPPAKIKNDFQNVQNQYARSISKDALIDEIQGLIEIEEYTKKNNLEELEKSDRSQAISCINEITKSSQLLKEDELKFGLPVNSDRLGKIGAKSAYNWVLMNSISKSSMTNWLELINVIPQKVMDEGSVYRSILQTADLLSQISEMAQAGIGIAKTEEEVEYYTHLKETSDKARELMIKTPVEV